MTHYNFDKDLQLYAHFHAPINHFMLALTQRPMRLLYNLQRSDKFVKVTKKTVESIRVLIYEPIKVVCNSRASACLLFFHGGGFVFNAAPHHFSLARRLVKELGFKCVFVDYRLAPKYKFPCAVDDCFEVYKWALNNAEKLGINGKKIVVSGDSAGGNLAAVCCLKARDCDLELPLAQMLLYPVLDYKMQSQSYKLYQTTPMCNSKDMAKYYKFYRGKNVVSPEKRAYLSPIEANNLKGLPTTYLEVAQYDCLHDEGVTYAKLLEHSGVEVELHEVSGAMHGYDLAKDTAFMQKIMTQRISFLKGILIQS